MPKPYNPVPGLEPEGGSWGNAIFAIIIVPIGVLIWAGVLWDMGKWAWRMAVGQ